MLSKSSRSCAFLTLLMAAPAILPASLSGQWVPSNPGATVVWAASLAPPALLAAGGGPAPSTELASESEGPRASGTVAQAAAGSAAPVVVGVASSSFSRRTAPALSPIVPLQERARGRTHIAMMTLGGAALAAGLMIGGDDGRIIALAGGVIGLTGLYRYLR